MDDVEYAEKYHLPEREGFMKRNIGTMLSAAAAISLSAALTACGGAGGTQAPAEAPAAQESADPSASQTGAAEAAESEEPQAAEEETDLSDQPGMNPTAEFEAVKATLTYMGGLKVKDDPSNDMEFALYRNEDGNLVGLVFEKGRIYYGICDLPEKATLEDGREYEKLKIEEADFGYYFSEDLTSGILVNEEGKVFDAVELPESRADELVKSTITGVLPESADAASASSNASASGAESTISDVFGEEVLNHKMETKLDGCATFTEIVNKLPKGKAYTNVKLGDTDALLVASGTYDNLDGNMAAIDAELFVYDENGAPAYAGFVTSGGTAYPLAVKDGSLYAGGNHFMCEYTLEKGELKTLSSAWVIYDSTGAASYYHTEEAGSTIADGTDDAALTKLYSELEGAEILNFDTIS